MKLPPPSPSGPPPLTAETLTWTVICPYHRLQPERGVAALVDGVQIAIFRTHDGSLYAIDNQDPIAGASVMSRGIVGTRGDAPTVASPLHKQVYDLRTGECLDVSGVAVAVYPVRHHDGLVQVCAEPAGASEAGAGPAARRPPCSRPSDSVATLPRSGPAAGGGRATDPVLEGGWP